MKIIFYVIQKEFIQVLRDKTMLRMILLIPMLQMLVLVFAATYDIKNINLFLTDKDHSVASRNLISKFRDSGFFTVSDFSGNEVDGEDQLLADKADMVLVIPAGFEHDLRREDKARLQLLVNAIDGDIMTGRVDCPDRLGGLHPHRDHHLLQRPRRESLCVKWIDVLHQATFILQHLRVG